MDKKRSNGVIIVGIMLIISSIAGILGRYADWRLLIYIPLFISGVGILFLKNWARVLSILILTIFTIETFIILKNFSTPILIIMQAFGVIYFLFLIYYLTRPKVKEQFK